MDFMIFFFFKQKTEYEMRISDWSSDVCSSDLWVGTPRHPSLAFRYLRRELLITVNVTGLCRAKCLRWTTAASRCEKPAILPWLLPNQTQCRSEEHTSELQSLMRISYAVFCLKKKNNTLTTQLPQLTTYTSKEPQI